MQELITQSKLCTPLALNYVVVTLQTLVILAAVGQRGTKSLAAAGVSLQTYQFFVRMPLLSLNSALDTKASQVCCISLQSYMHFNCRCDLLRIWPGSQIYCKHKGMRP